MTKTALSLSGVVVLLSALWMLSRAPAQAPPSESSSFKQRGPELQTSLDVLREQRAIMNKGFDVRLQALQRQIEELEADRREAMKDIEAREQQLLIKARTRFVTVSEDKLDVIMKQLLQMQRRLTEVEKKLSEKK